MRKEEFSLEDLILIFKRRIRWFWIAFLISVGVSIVYIFYTPPVYQATVRLKIESPGGVGPLTGNLGEIFGILPAPSGIETEVELIKSRSILKEVVDKLHLLERFRRENPEITLQKLLRKLEDMIEVEIVKNSNIVEIKVENEDPKLAADIANTLAKTYNDFLKDLSKNQYTLKREFIEEQLPKVKRDLKEIEDRIRKFKEEKGIFVIDEDAKRFLDLIYSYDKQLNDIEVQIKEAEIDMKFVEENLKKIEREIISSKTISINPVVTQLRAKLATLMIELSGLKAVYPPTNPKVVELERSIEETERLLEKEVERMITSQVQTVNPIYTNLLTRLFTDRAKIEALKAVKGHVEKLRDFYFEKMKEFPKLEQELMRLTREKMLKENLYTLLVQKLEEVRIAEAGILGNVQIVDSADVPEIPAKPSKKFVLAIGGAIGIFLGIFLAFLKEFTDKKIKDEYSIIWNVEVSRIWKIPKFKKFKYVNPESVELRKIASDIVLDAKKGVVGVASPSGSCGKTFLAVNLALIASKLGLKVAAVDLNFDESKLNEVLKSDGDVDVLKLGTGDLVSAISSGELKDVLEKAKEEYDLVMLDLPPLDLPETKLVLKMTDFTLLVVRTKKTSLEELERSIEDVERSGSKLLGVVLNFSR